MTRDLTLARLIIDQVPALARRAVAVPVKRFGTVTTWDPAANVAYVVVDGDPGASPIANATGGSLEPGERVVVDFYPPHGAVISGVLANQWAAPPSAARLFRTAAFSLTVSATIPTMVPFDATSYDFGTNTASGAYTCPHAGIYSLAARCSVVDAAVTERFVGAIFRDGVEAARGSDDGPVLSTLGISVAADLLCAAGDVLDFRVHQVNGVGRAIQTGEALAWLTVHQLR